ncbi:MAG: M1 family metallopeptidase [Anaerolineae bacterium]|nr:M1 family metallopeptidase [Anaerolineae bacterium]
MKPIHYSLYLEPDFKSFAFKGRVDIEIEVSIPVDPDMPGEQVVLDAHQLDIERCVLFVHGKEQECVFSVAPQLQQLVVALPSVPAGNFQLSIIYTGEINDELVGLYRSKYEMNGEVHYLAVTQFEEREARRVFPCFDQPSQKATFDIEYLIDDHLAGIANTPIREELLQDGGKKWVRFERTPKMSTYLLFFGIGDFEFIEEAAERWRVRVATTPGKTQYGEFALQMGRKSLEFGETYTGIPFPIAKCDHIAVPDFAFGAMENYGAITYRENALLVYPGVTSKMDLTRIASVIAHETAHMWFGNLVSPAAWKYIWLNESFATYFTYVITDHYYPEWQVWEMFIAESLMGGMWRDTLSETVPIELPGQDEINIDASSAPIIYSKGASIIRMLTAYLGEEKLRQGINFFLKQYAFESATSQDYWAAFETATGEPVSTFAESWVYQPGYPLVTVERQGDTLYLAQQRFSFAEVPSGQVWWIPVNILIFLEDGTTTIINTLMQESTMTLSLPAGTIAFKLNHDQTGFYRVRYDVAMLAALGDLIKAGSLSAIDSFGVQNDLFALACAGQVSITDYLNFVARYFAQEVWPLPLLNISENLVLLYRLLDTRREEVCHVGRGIFEHALSVIGMEPRAEDNLHISMLRDTLLWTAFTFGSEEVAAFGEAQFKTLLEGGIVHEDILSSVLKMGSVTSDRALEYLVNRVMAEATPETEKLSILAALGCFREPDKLRAVMELNLQSVPKKNRAYMLGSVAYNPVAYAFLWEWLLDHFEELRLLHPSHVGRILVNLVPVAGLGREAEVTRFLQAFASQSPMAENTVKMTLEVMAMYGRLRRSSEGI